MNSNLLFEIDPAIDLSIKTSKSSARKYPNVIWFPRSKTDLQEIREVLRLAKKVQEENPDNFFNDKTLGEKMARIGSINVVGKLGDEYVESYKDKSIGDVSYITNARMLMRLFRFLGFVTRISPSKYRLTDLGQIYTKFSGDFPAVTRELNEELVLLNSLGNFAFYCVNDDSAYRDSSFQVRPFVWLLNSLKIEPQCIYQLIVTTFASKRESDRETERIKTILANLSKGKTNLKIEFKRVGLDADDYSCVHNFYDSAKILVYIGVKLGLISKSVNPEYGRKIAGKAKNLKQATIFYQLTKKGELYLKELKQKRLLYYADVYNAIDKKSTLEAVFVLASLNFELGSKRVKSINADFFKKLFGESWQEIVNNINKDLSIKIAINDQKLVLQTPLSFNFWQSIPPEFFNLDIFQKWYGVLIEEVNKEKGSLIDLENIKIIDNFNGEVMSRFILDKNKDISYSVPELKGKAITDYVAYANKESVHGGQDRFASRISPTNSVFLVAGKVHVDNEKDALDLLVPLRRPDSNLKTFIHSNIDSLVSNFSRKTDMWEKDQHYTWVRNCFRLFGAEALYSGSSGMLSRADVSVIDPFIGGVEIKSPRENRGSIATKAIRQAVDAKIQVANKFPEKKDLPRTSIAIGRRITPLAIEEEKKWRKEGQPILLLNDMALYYLTLKTIDIPFDQTDILELFVKNYGLFDKKALLNFLEKVMSRHKIDSKEKDRIIAEVERLDLV